MSSPEIGPDKGIFKMATQKTAPGGRVAYPPFPERQTKARIKQPGEKNRLVTATRIGLAILAADTAGIAIDQQIDQQPTSLKNIAVQSVTWPWDLGKTAVKDISRVFRKEAAIPFTIDNSANQIIVKSGINGIIATDEDLSNIKNNITPPANPTEEHGLQTLPQFNILTPFLLKDGNQVSITKQYMSPGIDMSTGKTVEPAYIGGVNFVVSNKNTEVIPGIIDPEIASMEVLKLPNVITDKEYFGGVTIKVTRKDGTQYGLTFMSPEDLRSLAPLPILDDAPTYIKGQNVKGKLITGTTPIMRTDIADAKIRMGISRISDSNSVNDIFFSTIKFFESTDGKALLSPQQP